MPEGQHGHQSPSMLIPNALGANLPNSIDFYRPLVSALIPMRPSFLKTRSCNVGIRQ